MRKLKIYYFLWISIVFAFGCDHRADHAYSSRIESSSEKIDGNYGQDSNLLKLIEPYRNILSDSINTVIGNSKEDILKGFPQNPLGNLIADMMIRYTRNNYEQSVDFALTNNGGLRVPIKKGEITMGDIFELMPFENELIVLELNDSDMLNLFNYIRQGESMALSEGIVVYYQDQTFQKALIGQNNYEPGNKTYSLLTTDYLANGGSGMSFLKQIEKREPVGIRLRDVIIFEVIDRCKDGASLTPTNNQRIFFDE